MESGCPSLSLVEDSTLCVCLSVFNLPDICWKGNAAIQAVRKISGQRQGHLLHTGYWMCQQGLMCSSICCSLTEEDWMRMWSRMAALAVVTKKQLQILRGVREVSTRVPGPALLESKLPLIQEDGRQDNVGDSSEE